MDTRFAVVVLFMVISNGRAQTYTSVRTDYQTLVNFYANSGKSLTNLIPKTDQSTAIEVDVTMYMYSIDGFDAVNGQIEISGAMFLEWTDETKESTIGSFSFSSSGGTTIFLSPDKLWTPKLILLNAVDTVKSVGDSSYKLRYDITTGHVKWQPRVMIKSSCTPDIQFYPFDRQTCSFIYTPWGYTSSEVDLVLAQSDWALCDYTSNGLWRIVSTTTSEYAKDNSPYVQFTVTIERQPLYFILNVILPILLLGILNGFVFLLPADSGERVGFCVTCFLSFIFLLQTTMGFLPETSQPMSLLCYYLVVMMCFSIFISILTIIMLRVYHKPATDQVPSAVQSIVRAVECLWLKPCCKAIIRPIRNRLRKLTAVAPTDNEDAVSHSHSTIPEIELIGVKPIKPEPSADTEQPGSSNSNDEGTPETPQEIGWPDVGRVLDFFFFLAFCGAQSAFTVFFLIPLGAQY